jgi:hypothetical protein
MVCHAWRSALYSEPFPRLSLRENAAFYQWLQQRKPSVLQLDWHRLEDGAFFMREACRSKYGEEALSARAQKLRANVSRALHEHLDGKVRGSRWQPPLHTCHSAL